MRPLIRIYKKEAVNMKIRKISVYIIEFIICSVIGWTYETVLTSAVYGSFADRGFLDLPLCPIYGFSAMLLLVMFGRVKNTGAVFVLSASAVTVIELVCSYLLEIILNLKLWDYSGWAFNFDGRISLISSLIFGALGLLLIKVIHPAAVRLEKILPESTAFMISALLTLTVSADLIACLSRL